MGKGGRKNKQRDKSPEFVAPSSHLTSHSNSAPTGHWAKLSALGIVKPKKPASGSTRKLFSEYFVNKLPLKLRGEVFLSAFSHAISRAFERERDLGTSFHFAPLILALGICLYYIAPAEPSLWVLLATTAPFVVASVLVKQHGKGWLILCALALLFAGMSAAKIRSSVINNHSLSDRITGQLAGTIIEVTRNRRGAPRYLIIPDTIENIDQHQLPNYIRLSAASKHPAAKPGDLISGLARLQPVSGPAFPGSFDFSFNSWHDGLGGTGFFMGKPQIKTANPGASNLPLSIRFTIAVNNLRSKISARIRKGLPGESGDLAVALIVGDRTGINPDTQESLRASGIAHILAISGMHMALVSLTMVWSVRFLLALNVSLATTRPIKNWAAVAGFITATSYLVISGMGVATQRAWIMISVMIVAAIINRKAITLRGVAIAALVILVLQPEAVLSPGFQMSFAAVAAIVAAYEWLDERRKVAVEYRRPNRVVRFFGALIFTSLIAGLATSLFAAYHFHRVAPFGVLTNLLAMPLISTIVMPSALVSVLALPYGFEQLPLVPLGVGIDWVVAISNFVNSLYSDSFGLSGVTGKLAGPVLPMALIGLFMLTMLKTMLRLSGIVILAASMLFWQSGSVPDIMLSEDGRAIAIKDSEGKLALLYPRRNKFVRDIWLRAYSGDEPGKLQIRDKLRGQCNKDFCSATTPQGALVYVVYDPDLLAHGCQKADILLAPKLRWVNCRERKPALVIKRGDLEEFGAVEIYLAKNQPTVAIADGQTLLPKQPEFQILKVVKAVPDSNRPWNVHRQGRATYLQD